MPPEKPKSANSKRAPTPASAPPSKTVLPPAAPPPKPPPLFRRVDWLAFGISTLVILIGYLWTLAPDLTLEDSGELAVASYYAGVPHPPGYPVWTIYTWFFTLLPIANIAYRVAISSAVAGALACGLIGLMVSRGSSMMLEGIIEFKTIERRWENLICAITGVVAAMLMGFNGFMWSQAVIVEVYTLSVLSLTGVLCMLMRWIYAPHQHRYLYFAWFLFGICFNNHQSLIVSALAIEVAVAAIQPRLGRDLFLGNFVLYVLGLVGKGMGMVSVLEGNVPLFLIYHFIGLISGMAFLYYWIQTKKVGDSLHWGFICFLAFCLGAAFYVYMPVASMTNPPLNWGYPRTETGFFHAFTRGQYERIHPTTSLVSYFKQVAMLVEGAIDEFNLVYLLVGLVPFLFYKRLQKREQAWLIGLAAFYIVLGPFLLVLLNPATDRQSLSLNRVFFTASHVLIAMGIGYGLALIVATLATQYAAYRFKVIMALAIASGLGLYGFANTLMETPYHMFRYAALLGLVLAVLATALLLLSRERPPILPLLVVIAFMPLHSILSHWSENEQRGHLFGFWFGHDMFTPPFKGPDGKLTYSRKLREEMMKKPGGELIYPEMDKDTILFGGTDPGRFCPTYTIFCESFIPPEKRRNPEYDRRDVYIITQNALADGTYLNYIRAHYNRSAQIDPPFFQEMFRSTRESEANYRTNVLARMMVPVDRFFLDLGDRIEKDRRAGSSMFEADHFLKLPEFARKLNEGSGPGGVSKYLRDQLSPRTLELLKTPGNRELASALAEDLNRWLNLELEATQRLPEARNELQQLASEIASAPAKANRALKKKQQRHKELEAKVALYTKVTPFFDPNRFQGVALSEYLNRFIRENPQSHSRIRLNRLLLEAAYGDDLAKSLGGVYPDIEIYTPSNEDSQRCFSEYMADAQRRMQSGQLKPGEDVRVIDNKVQVSGQVAVMAINGLLTKVIFEHNPQNEFYVEESFPLDWMYPYLSPFGIIMKINRQPLPELTELMVRRDHQFWSDYSERLIGNWITYDTPISNICAFAEQVYVRHDYRAYKGDMKFVRDDDAQKAFSKLRSSIAGVYAWRINNSKTAAEQQRMLKEAEFAFKQAYAFCPYSPEALFRFVNVLIGVGRVDEARMLAITSQKLDPYNVQLEKLVEELDKIKNMQTGAAPAQNQAAQMARFEAEYRTNPANLANAMQLAQALAQMGQTNRVVQIADHILATPTADANAIYLAVQVYQQVQDLAKLEVALQRWAMASPTPEAWLDLAAIQSLRGNTPKALASLRQALQLNTQRLAANPAASNIALLARTDPRLAMLRQRPEFQQLVGTNR